MGFVFIILFQKAFAFPFVVGADAKKINYCGGDVLNACIL